MTSLNQMMRSDRKLIEKLREAYYQNYSTQHIAAKYGLTVGQVDAAVYFFKFRRRKNVCSVKKASRFMEFYGDLLREAESADTLWLELDQYDIADKVSGTVSISMPELRFLYFREAGLSLDLQTLFDTRHSKEFRYLTIPRRNVSEEKNERKKRKSKRRTIAKRNQ